MKKATPDIKHIIGTICATREVIIRRGWWTHK